MKKIKILKRNVDRSRFNTFKNSYDKSQAAMEFLSTYGWALLAVLLVIMSLAYFGILDISRFLPDKVDMPLYITPLNAKVGNDSVIMILKNSAGKNIKDLIVNITTCNNSQGSLSAPVFIKEGDSQVLTIPCNHSVASGKKFKSDILVSYIITTMTQDIEHVGNGMMRVEVSEASITLLTVECGDGETECSGSCVNLNTDELNCGSCGTECSGTCCSGNCIDTDTSFSNCGGCGNACSAGQMCIGGICTEAPCEEDGDCNEGMVCCNNLCYHYMCDYDSGGNPPGCCINECVVGNGDITYCCDTGDITSCGGWGYFNEATCCANSCMSDGYGSYNMCCDESDVAVCWYDSLGEGPVCCDHDCLTGPGGFPYCCGATDLAVCSQSESGTTSCCQHECLEMGTPGSYVYCCDLHAYGCGYDSIGNYPGCCDNQCITGSGGYFEGKTVCCPEGKQDYCDYGNCCDYTCLTYIASSYCCDENDVAMCPYNANYGSQGNGLPWCCTHECINHGGIDTCCDPLPYACDFMTDGTIGCCNYPCLLGPYEDVTYCCGENDVDVCAFDADGNLGPECCSHACMEAEYTTYCCYEYQTEFCGGCCVNCILGSDEQEHCCGETDVAFCNNGCCDHECDGDGNCS